MNAIPMELVQVTGPPCKKGKIKYWPLSLSVVY